MHRLHALTPDLNWPPFPMVKVTGVITLCTMRINPRYVREKFELILWSGSEANICKRISATYPAHRTASTKSNTYRFPFHLEPNYKNMILNYLCTIPAVLSPIMAKYLDFSTILTALIWFLYNENESVSCILFQSFWMLGSLDVCNNDKS